MQCIVVDMLSLHVAPCHSVPLSTSLSYRSQYTVCSGSPPLPTPHQRQHLSCAGCVWPAHVVSTYPCAFYVDDHAFWCALNVTAHVYICPFFALCGRSCVRASTPYGALLDAYCGEPVGRGENNMPRFLDDLHTACQSTLQNRRFLHHLSQIARMLLTYAQRGQSPTTPIMRVVFCTLSPLAYCPHVPSPDSCATLCQHAMCTIIDLRAAP